MAKDLTKKQTKAKAEEAKPVDTRKRVERYATAAHPYIKAGEITVITEHQAELQEKRGYLVKTKAEALATVPADMLEEMGEQAPKETGNKGKGGKAGKAENADDLA